MYRSHNPSYLWFLRTSAERDADPGSVAVRANDEREIDSTEVVPNEALSHREWEHSHAIRGLAISTIKTNWIRTALKPADDNARLMMSFKAE